MQWMPVGRELTQEPKLSTNPSSVRLDNRWLLIIVSVVVVVFLVDSNIGYVADFIPDWLVTNEGIGLFIGISVVFAAGGLLILRFVKQNNKQSKIRGLKLGAIHNGVAIAHYVLIGIVALVIGQVLLTSQYNLFLLHLTVSISYGLWIITLGLLTRAFLSWYKSSSKNAMIIVLALSMIAYVVNGIAGVAVNFAYMELQPQVVASDYVAFFPGFDPETIQSQISFVWQMSSAAAYVLTWIGTVMLLRPYIHRIGKAKFYAILGTAMIYYLITYPLFVLGYFTPTEETDADAMNNILIFGIASVLSGIIFGAAFLAVAKTLQKGSVLRQYMIIAAFGLLLFYVAGSASVYQAAYPPYGLATVAFTGLSCYLIYAGLYASAATVSQDLALRQSIRSTLASQANLLDSIGTAQMEQELQGTVLKVAKKAAETIEEETGVEPSMTDDEMKDYLEIVMNEMKAKGKGQQA
jgi:hypothetical protein